MTAPYFRFESDFVDSLRCIPMAVRLKLDVCGVKLKLNEWSKLDQSDRELLVNQPCGTPAEAENYRYSISNLVAAKTGAAPSPMPPVDPQWSSGESIPAQVLDQAHSLNLEIELRTWAALAPLQRFALIKLSRPGHENRNFLPALKEFGFITA